MRPTGDCFEAAALFILDVGDDSGIVLAHGEATGKGKIDGVQHVHAWAELNDQVIDVSNGKNLSMPKSVYYDLGNITNVVLYTPMQVRHRMLDIGTYGPWDDYLMEVEQ